MVGKAPRDIWQVGMDLETADGVVCLGARLNKLNVLSKIRAAWLA